MRKHRFFVPSNLIVGSAVALDADISHYIMRVLRLNVNDVIFVFNNSGYEYQAKIQDIDRKSVTISIIDALADAQESPLQINLAQVIGKGEKMDLVIQKATELGVNSITPLYSERTVAKNIASKVEHKMEHWQKIAIAASAQSWRNYVPQIHVSQTLDSWLLQTHDSHKLILSTIGSTKKINQLQIQNAVTILVGPEGGFSDAELELAQQQNFTAVSLGPRILRTETAGIAVVAMLQAIYGDC